MPGHSMLQMEHEYAGSDYSINLKAMNPNPMEFTGLYVASYLQSVTSKLAIGSEVVLQRPTPDMEETAMSLVGKYTGNDYIATAQFQGLGAIQASYYQRINEKVDFGVEINLLMQGQRREGVATVGGKFDFRQATFRGQIDTTGRVSAVLEEKMAPGFSFLISGDLDHMKVHNSIVNVEILYSSFLHYTGPKQIRCRYHVVRLDSSPSPFLCIAHFIKVLDVYAVNCICTRLMCYERDTLYPF